MALVRAGDAGVGDRASSTSLAPSLLATAMVAGASAVHGSRGTVAPDDSQPAVDLAADQQASNTTRPEASSQGPDNQNASGDLTGAIADAAVHAAKVATGPAGGLVAQTAIAFGVPLAQRARRSCDRRSRGPNPKSPATTPPVSPLKVDSDLDNEIIRPLETRVGRIEEALEKENNSKL